MVTAKPLLLFVARFAVVFGLLMAPWSVWENAYAKYFRATGNLFLHNFGSKALVFFVPGKQPAGSLYDTTIVLGHRRMVLPDGGRPSTNVTCGSRYIGYLRTVLVVALILATPLPWKRRAWALLWGLIWVHVFIGLTLAVMIIHQYSLAEWLTLFQGPPWWKHLLNSVHQVLVAYIGASFIVPVFIWILASFRREDWQALAQWSAAVPKPREG